MSSHLLALVEDLCTHLLILHRGKQLFWGTAGEARASFASGEQSLEEVFLHGDRGAIVAGC